MFGALIKRVGWEAEIVMFLPVLDQDPYSEKYLETHFLDRFRGGYGTVEKVKKTSS